MVMTTCDVIQYRFFCRFNSDWMGIAEINTVNFSFFVLVLVFLGA